MTASIAVSLQLIQQNVGNWDENCFIITYSSWPGLEGLDLEPNQSVKNHFLNN